jgi:type II secretory pathway pseudopilin PulG
MKNIQYLFIFILIVILSISFYFYYDTRKEGLETQEQQQTIQEIIEKYTGDLYKKVNDMIATKTSEGEKLVNEKINANKEVLNNLMEKSTSNKEDLIKKTDELLDKLEAKKQNYNVNKMNNISYGITVEIDEKDKIQSIVNKYLTQ